ncbi:hypothetical protein J2X68_005723 [Streptomyces sp. 3330]|nr:hypothetical protein [Streptomyces sp. 3330]MDR6978989.1 hypothetical protein [Streptomyces sp. 3330]
MSAEPVKCACRFPDAACGKLGVHPFLLGFPQDHEEAEYVG